jgi:hypothetical protein
MKSAQRMRRVAIACGNAALGAIIGAMLAAFCHVIGGSTPGMVTTIVLVSAFGGWVEGFAGAMCGLICGAMMVAFGHVVGGSTIGIVSIIIVCALIAGWLSWNGGPDANDDSESESQFTRIPKAAVIYASAIANIDHPCTRSF